LNPPQQDPPALDLSAAQGGDRAALERVLIAIRPLVARLALRFFGCPTHAEDATQEVLLQVATHLGSFEGRSAFSTWVHRVATNRFLSMARSPAEAEITNVEDFEADLARRDPSPGWRVDAPTPTSTSWRPRCESAAPSRCC
jgi:RNA polymerase sigma-70 factor (ECF subfamily)